MLHKIFDEISRCSSVGCSLGFPKLSKALTQVTLSIQLKDRALKARISLREVGESSAGVLEGVRSVENQQHCRMDLPRPTTSVGIRTDYSVGPWDYPTCAARHPLA
jgi:hypothetical protein